MGGFMVVDIVASTLAGISNAWSGDRGPSGNIALASRDFRCLNTFEIDEYLAIIKGEIQKFYKEVAAVGKQETWTKVIVHKVDLERFPDMENRMKSLHTELET